MRNMPFTLALFVLLAASTCLSAEEPAAPPAHTSGGLQLLPAGNDIEQVWMKPGTDLAKYQRVYLVEPTVVFRKNWLADQNRGHPSMRVRPSDMENIKRDMQQIFMEVFTAELLAAGYGFSELRDHDVMIVKPAILRLDINAPDVQVPNTTDVLTSAAGSMTLYMEIYDSVSEELLVKAIDPATDREAGNAQIQKNVANRAAARRMMTPWAQALANGFGAATE